MKVRRSVNVGAMKGQLETLASASALHVAVVGDAVQLEVGNALGGGAEVEADTILLGVPAVPAAVLLDLDVVDGSLPSMILAHVGVGWGALAWVMPRARTISSSFLMSSSFIWTMTLLRHVLRSIEQIELSVVL
ncbi:hypothetical protein [Bradyrhizobium sp. CW11]|uniref:hypothetical protein n=1 Tax=Bradyrhizobium sp. CW11 TaxID=2782684 RepID=UPI001FF9A82D|nr:hypothetical protein [Bradyrhizobium sp. CW11]MCK1348254.1 hypothetical protein [Bradyrhizobium sp. CW11]